MACLCGRVNQLIVNFDPETAAGLVLGLNKHLKAIQSILTWNKSLAKEWDDNVRASYNVANLIQGRTLSELRYADFQPVAEADEIRYERYLNIDDAEAFDHMQNLGSDAPDLNLFAKRLIAAQLDGCVLVRYSTCCFVPAGIGARMKEVDIINIVQDHQPRASFPRLQPVTDEPKHVDVGTISPRQLSPLCDRPVGLFKSRLRTRVNPEDAGLRAKTVLKGRSFLFLNSPIFLLINFDTNVIQQVIIFPVLITAFLAISRAAPDYSPFPIDLHNTLTEFSARGQLTLELFAPLSTTLAPSQPTLEFLTGTCHFMWALIAVESFHVSKVDSISLWAVARVRKMAGNIADLRYSPIRLVLQSSANIAIAFIGCPLLALLIVGSLIPMSKSAAGGNYNLSYLSASLRTYLTPFPVLDRLPMLGVTGSGLTDLTAYTIYLPRSGFLWSDNMIWQQSLPDQIPDSEKDHVDEDGKHWSVDGSRRVFFQDKFLARHPWEVQKYPRPRQITQWSKRVLAGDTIRLHDPIASQYLCAIPGERVVSEAGYFGTNSSTRQDLDRIRIGTVSNTGSASCDWTVYYDAIQGSVNFYNPSLKCDLASTFRSLPHSEPARGNDTVLRLLDLRLEASCTVGASESSSRLYTIESFARHQSQKAVQKGPDENQQTVVNVGAFRRAIEYHLARRRLASFRNHHSQLQEEAIGTGINEVQGMSRPFDLSKPDIVICGFYVVAVILARVTKRKLSDEANGSLRNGCCIRLAWLG
ncbi:hypothetical protein FGADI_13438 [Fusarium gaditjirri]|uniref:Uncharacterized protein n=1 Tax=Fusarium gaditjirri TaxID=282569 RepID=A0A8H4WMT5_9HYPO|nr:hypothetical protein FGADI_13438 [Fusarium gaditjirri]